MTVLISIATYSINHIFAYQEGLEPAIKRAERALSAYLACRQTLIESIALLLREDGNYYKNSDIIRADTVKLYECIDALLTHMTTTRMKNSLGKPITGTNFSPRDRWIPHVAVDKFHNNGYLPITFNLPQEAFTASKPGYQQNQKLVLIHTFILKRFPRCDTLHAPFLGGNPEYSSTTLSSIFSPRTAFNQWLTPEGVVHTILEWLVHSFRLIDVDTEDEMLDDDITIYKALELYRHISACIGTIIAYTAW